MANEKNLTSAISRSINRQSSKNDGRKIAFSLDDAESPSEVDHWISTGSTVLDLMISNKEDGGLPTGKIGVFYGPSGSGKTLIANHVLANCQQMGGVSVMIDTEAAADFDFMRTIGLDPDGDFLYVGENRLERIFDYIETVIEKVKEKGNDDRPVAIVVDSIAGAVPENEYEGDYGKEGYNTDKAIVLSQAMRKINGLINRENVLLLFTNQVRTDPSVMYGNPHTTPGGKAVKFHSSVRVHMRKAKTIKENKEIVGANIRPQITKNRLAPPHRYTNFDLYYNSGIDDYGSWWEPLKNADIIDHSAVSSRSWYGINDENGEPLLKSDLPVGADKDEPYKTQEKRFKKKLHSNPEFRSIIYDRLVEAITHEYEDGWVDRSDTEYVSVNGEAESEEESE
jgi:RecA/RadA recombinase